MKRSPESGFSFLKLIFFIAVVVAGLMVVGKILPAYYDFMILKDLANRVVGEYSHLSLREVKRRVDFEVDRSNIDWPEDTFLVEPKSKGYQVTIDYTLIVDLSFQGKSFGKFTEIHFFYEVES